MPIWLRKFTFKELETYYSDQKETMENQSLAQNQTSLVNTDGNINAPAFTNVSKPYKGQSSYK